MWGLCRAQGIGQMVARVGGGGGEGRVEWKGNLLDEALPEARVGAQEVVEVGVAKAVEAGREGQPPLKMREHGAQGARGGSVRLLLGGVSLSCSLAVTQARARSLSRRA